MCEIIFLNPVTGQNTMCAWLPASHITIWLLGTDRAQIFLVVRITPPCLVSNFLVISPNQPEWQNLSSSDILEAAGVIEQESPSEKYLY